MAEKIFLIDGSALYYRSYFAFIKNPLINSKGENTSATFGFLSALVKLIEDEAPQYLAIVFDTKEPTFRHEIYEEYKATREKMPEEMAAQYPRLVDSLKRLNFTLLEKAGYEADDIIGTLARRYGKDDQEVFIVSGDKDMAQLVNDHVFLYNPGRSNKEAEILDAEAIKQKMGVSPSQITDWLALMGDQSDNIPGVEKVGEKTAVKLLNEYDSIDNLYEHIDEMKESAIKRNLMEARDQTGLARELTTIHTDVDIGISLDELQFSIWDMEEADQLLKELEFRRLYNRMLALAQKYGTAEAFAKHEQSGVQYKLIQNAPQFEGFMADLSRQEKFAFDIETSALDFTEAAIAGMSFAWQEKEAWYVAIGHTDSELDAEAVLRGLKPVMEDETRKKIGQNIKFDALILKHHGIEVQGIYFDTMIASYLTSPSGQHNMDKLAEYYLNYEMIPIEDIIGSGRKQIKMTDLAAADVLTYAAEDADITFRLYNILKDKVSDFSMEELFYQLEVPLIRVLLDMEYSGVRLDTDLLRNLSQNLSADIERIKNNIFEETGQSFNLNSTQQLGPILFDQLKIHEQLGMRTPSKTKTGQYSTAENTLLRYIDHPLIQKIMEYRKLVKLQNTYVYALPLLIREATGKVHTSFNQTVAATGRLSSSNPNLQNIPIRTELGREIRKAFIPSQKNYVMLSADYSQIELRIIAHLSQDQTMMEQFRNNMDIHAATASLIFDIPLEEVDNEYRRRAKAINFGIIYGMSRFGLASRLDIPEDEAKEFIDDYMATYPRIQAYMQNSVEKARQEGYVETMMHRRRYLPEINSKNRQIREFAERTAINTPIQGSAADFIKKAMLNIHDFIQKEKPSATMLLQVHDELVFEVAEKEAKAFAEKIKSLMESAIDLKVPVVVDAGMGANWLEAHE
ncbi:MAG: DNA polymerase I [Caldithrix sp.]|nr:DNA polymerase I [Caldithrix sp.]